MRATVSWTPFGSISAATIGMPAFPSMIAAACPMPEPATVMNALPSPNVSIMSPPKAVGRHQDPPARCLRSSYIHHAGQPRDDAREGEEDNHGHELHRDKPERSSENGGKRNFLVDSGNNVAVETDRRRDEPDLAHLHRQDARSGEHTSELQSRGHLV